MSEARPRPGVQLGASESRAGAQLDEVVRRLLDVVSDMSPENLPAVLVQEAAVAGVPGVVVYLQDFDHRLLLPLTGSAGGAGLSAEPVEGSAPGDAFRSDALVVCPESGGSRVFVPLRDGGERVGILALTLPGVAGRDVPEPAVWRLSRLVASLLVVKGAYSDAFFFARRRKPMALAAEMQWQLLPPLTLQSPRVSIAGMLAPAYEVGGDSFDYALQDGVLHFAIFDAMGHGLRASILATAVVSAYRHARRGRVGLRDKYALADDVVREQFGGEHFVTAQMADLDVNGGVLRWVNAGHPRPLLVRHGRVVRSLRSDTTLPIGLAGETPQVSEEELQPGDRLVFFTDGVIEERTPDGGQLGLPGFGAFLERVERPRLPVAETVRQLSLELTAGWNSGSPKDDVTIVLLEWHP